jgi:hypothetical protein
VQPITGLGLKHHLTFKGNLKHSRYGWLRLTPAYSVHLVSELLDRHAHDDTVVLDPFCGTGTTALACAERGIACHTTDINPFLLWLTEAKTRSYTPGEVAAALAASERIERAITAAGDGPAWVPPLHQIEKWWDEDTLAALSRAFAAVVALGAVEASPPAVDLLKVAFCRTMIEAAHVSFGHQSMSFKRKQTGSLFEIVETPADVVAAGWKRAVAAIAEAAHTPIREPPTAILCDARRLTGTLARDAYGCVITSPPYPNRMSYIRELRPYLYWLGYLRDGRAAGELDWQVIGGTWGCATSNVGKWRPPDDREIDYPGFREILARIAASSDVLSRYVHKYFLDMLDHCGELFAVVKPGGTVHYVVGNSKFYDVVLPVEAIYAALFASARFEDVAVETIRKRTSKKELYEFVVSARKPSI